MNNYTILNKSEWQTSLCKCDSESCFLSCIVPCHVYSKIRSRTKSEYCVHLCVYIFLYLSLQQLWYSQKYVINNTCPSTVVSSCLSITSDIANCNKYSILIDEDQYSCIEQNGICISNKNTCIEIKDSKNISINLIIFTSISYFILTCLHYLAREYIKSKQIIENSIIEDIFAVVCCPTCGIAQEYREL